MNKKCFRMRFYVRYCSLRGYCGLDETVVVTRSFYKEMDDLPVELVDLIHSYKLEFECLELRIEANRRWLTELIDMCLDLICTMKMSKTVHAEVVCYLMFLLDNYLNSTHEYTLETQKDTDRVETRLWSLVVTAIFDLRGV